MLGSLLLSLGAVSVVSAFPRRAPRVARSPANQYITDVLVCPAPSTVTSYIPVITTIPEGQGNLAGVNSIISQGQTYVTSSLASSQATGSIGQVVGGVTAINTGAVATNAAFPTFTICDSQCTVAGGVFASGTVYYTGSAVVQPSTTAIVGGQTLSSSTGLVTSATPITLTYYSTVINGATVTDGSMPLTTVTRGIDGAPTTVVQQASEVISSANGGATIAPPIAASGGAITTLVTVVVPSLPTPVTLVLTEVISTGPDGIPTASIIVPGAANDATPLTTTGSNGQPTPVTDPGNAGVGQPSNGAGAAGVSTSIVAGQASPTVDPSSSLSPSSKTVVVINPTTSASPCTSDEECSGLGLGLCLDIGLIPSLGANVGLCASVGSTSAIIDLGASATVSIPVVLPTSATGGSEVSSVSCQSDDECAAQGLGLCLDVAFDPLLGLDAGVCAGLVLSPTSVGIALGASVTLDLPAPSLSLSLPVVLPTGTSTTSPTGTGSSTVACRTDDDCLSQSLGLCLDLALDPVLGYRVGVCAGVTVSPTSLGAGGDVAVSVGGLTPSVSVTVPVVAPTITSGSTLSPGDAGACSSDADCASQGLGLCLGLDLVALGQASVGVCAGVTISPTSIGVGAGLGLTATVPTTLPTTAPGVSLSASVGAAGTVTIPVVVPTSVISLTPGGGSASNGAAVTCTSDSVCQAQNLGLCLGLDVPGATAGLCAGVTVSPSTLAVGVGAGATASIPVVLPTTTLAIITAPATTATTVATGQTPCQSNADCTGLLGVCVGLTNTVTVGLCAV